MRTRLSALTLLTASSILLAADGPLLTPVPFTDVKVEDQFWAPRIETNRTATVTACLEQCEKTGRLSNFSKAAGHIPGKYEGAFFNDSDVYKVIEGIAYCLAAHPDKDLEARTDKIIDEIAAAQQPDGYMNAYYTLMEPDKRWTDLSNKHELYCAGHMFEAAVAYAQATGKTKFLDVSRRMADHIDKIFGPGEGKRIGWSGHPEIELALVKLYRYTGEERYAKLAEHFVNVRGTRKLENNDHQEYMQAHKPIREQTDVVGHAVRAMYLYAGVTDLAAMTGDAKLFTAMDTIWHNVVDKKMYVTGGVGARHAGEAFGENYELPNDTAYCETCAAIGLALWNQRLLNLKADGRYADVIERAIYNGVLSGVSLQGNKFFYVNPLASNGKHHREPWYGCACCPTNVVRFIPAIPGYIYSISGNGVYVNLYVASTAQTKIKSGPVSITQKTEYPWSGDVAITVNPAAAAEFDVCVRIPQWWCRAPQIKVAGEPLNDFKTLRGYVALHRTWKPGDTIELSLPMPVERVYAHPSVAADRGRVALQRGPIVYCAEAVDNGGHVFNLILPPTGKLSTGRMAGFAGSGDIVAVKAEGLAVEPADWAGGKLFQSATAVEPAEITAIPYCLWDHRAAGEMEVWLSESASLAASKPAN